MKKHLMGIVWLGVITIIVLPGMCFAYNDAKDCWPAPAGTNLAVLYYDHTAGHELFADGSKVEGDLNYTADIGLFRYVTYFPFFEKIGCFNFVIPFGDVSMDGSAMGQQNLAGTGLGDLVLNFGAALFGDRQKGYCFNMSGFIVLPTGEYSHDRAVNLGSNRYAFKPEISMCKYLTKNISAELFASADFYTDNDDFGVTKVTLEQDPVYYVNTHLVYDINPATYASIDYYYEYGGETTVDHVAQNNEKNDHYMQFTYAQMFTPAFQFMVKYKAPLEIENGCKAGTIGVRLTALFLNN